MENLLPGSIVVIELKDHRVSSKKSSSTREVASLAWAVVHMDDSSVNTGPVNLEMFSYPVDLKLQKMEPIGE